MKEKMVAKKGKKEKNAEENAGEKEEAYRLEDGTTVKKFCLDKMAEIIEGSESIWDILTVVTRLVRLEVKKDENGFVIDVDLIFPKVDEVVIAQAIMNFRNFQFMRENGYNVPNDELFESRRFKLQKFIESNEGKLI